MVKDIIIQTNLECMVIYEHWTQYEDSLYTLLITYSVNEDPIPLQSGREFGVAIEFGEIIEPLENLKNRLDDTTSSIRPITAHTTTPYTKFREYVNRYIKGGENEKHLD